MEDDAPYIEPGRGRLVYNKTRRVIESQPRDESAELHRRTIERDYHKRTADILADNINHLRLALESIVDMTARVDDGCNCTVCQIRRIAIRSLDAPHPSPDLKVSPQPTVSSETTFRAI